MGGCKVKTSVQTADSYRKGLSMQLVLASTLLSVGTPAEMGDVHV